MMLRLDFDHAAWLHRYIFIHIIYVYMTMSHLDMSCKSCLRVSKGAVRKTSLERCTSIPEGGGAKMGGGDRT